LFGIDFAELLAPVRSLRPTGAPRHRPFVVFGQNVVALRASVQAAASADANAFTPSGQHPCQRLPEPLHEL
jgi:hypothetical protein